MKKPLCLLLCFLLTASLFSGCEKKEPSPPEDVAESTAAPVYTAPDGNSSDATCKGSYLGTPEAKQIVASCSSRKLTQGVLQVLYDLEVQKYQASASDEGPDFSLPLSQQQCIIDSSVNTWQQYFLRQALNTWHTAQSLVLTSQERGIPAEEAFQPDPKKYDDCLVDIPATEYLYRYRQSYTPNSMHQAFLSGLEETLSDLASKYGYPSIDALASDGLHTTKAALLDAANLYNTGYMYLTAMEDSLVPEEDEYQAFYQENKSAYSGQAGKYADIHQILLTPSPGASEASWGKCMETAEKLLSQWAGKYRAGEGSFSQLAYETSADKGSSLLGGLYWHVAQGTLLPELDRWVFSPERAEGDTGIVRTGLGIHILYYAGGGTEGYQLSRDDMTRKRLNGFMESCRNKHPMTVSYPDIVLAEAPTGTNTLSYNDILYPDIAHERFPEVPLYLQQDYGEYRYGNYPLRTYGCGITSLAMLSSYMTDTELTPPIMCDRYGSYCSNWGTDYMIFRYEPPTMGYFLRDQVFDPDVAYQALEDGYILVSCQQKGYWTKTGHYIVIEKLDKDGVQVRDSNIYNYKRIPAHKTDRHSWKSITSASVSYWIFEKKQVRSPMCSRCGNPEEYANSILQSDYHCKRCAAALLRRNCYLDV